MAKMVQMRMRKLCRMRVWVGVGALGASGGSPRSGLEGGCGFGWLVGVA